MFCQSAKGFSGVLFEATGDDGRAHVWKLEERPKETLILDITERPEGWSIPHLTYLSAERIGPRDVLDVESVPSEELTVGVQGEFTAQVLAGLAGAGRKLGQVRHELLHPKTEELGNVTQIGKQVELWLGDITPGVELLAQTMPGTNVSSLRLKRLGVATDWLRPPNIGFGVSYTLPIIVAGLLAPPGSLFLVENPEGHLHPAGQSSIGRFLAVLAAAGVQVIVETHSDHVLSGVRLAAVDPGHPVKYEQIIVQFFHGKEGTKERAQPIDVTAKGGLSVWPAGFFDQSEKDLAAILEARRPGR